eukprot:2888023-Amphidinium_carterae.1
MHHWYQLDGCKSVLEDWMGLFWGGDAPDKTIGGNKNTYALCVSLSVWLSVNVASVRSSLVSFMSSDFSARRNVANALLSPSHAQTCAGVHLFAWLG